MFTTVTLDNHGYRLSLRNYMVEYPKAVIQIAHGMEEHQGRYEEFANFLNTKGYAVVTADMRGHGENAEILGHFADKDGYKLLLSDMLKIRRFIESEYEDVPVYLLAHSMGTIISRVFLQKHSDKYEKCVLIGYPCHQPHTFVGLNTANAVVAAKGAQYRSEKLGELTTGTFNKEIKTPRTTCDWICTRNEVVDGFIADPLCGQGFTAAGYRDLYSLVELMHDPKLYRNVNRDLRIYMLRGTADPCTGGDNGAKDSREVLINAGFKLLAYKDYEGMRHELLNETVRYDVYEDIAEFFNK